MVFTFRSSWLWACGQTKVAWTNQRCPMMNHLIYVIDVIDRRYIQSPISFLLVSACPFPGMTSNTSMIHAVYWFALASNLIWKDHIFCYFNLSINFLNQFMNPFINELPTIYIIWFVIIFMEPLFTLKIMFFELNRHLPSNLRRWYWHTRQSMDLPLPTTKHCQSHTTQLDPSAQLPQLDVWYRHR
jgi:hypothetical protein